METNDSQFRKKHSRRKRPLVVGGVVIPAFGNYYWTTWGGWGGYGGGQLTTARDTDGTGSDTGSDAGDAGGDAGGSVSG